MSYTLHAVDSDGGALRNFESYGGRAREMEDETKGLIADIEKALSGQPSAFSE